MFQSFVACEASVSLGFSARSRHFSLFGGAKIGASATLKERGGGGEARKGNAFPFLPSPPPCSHFFALAPIFARSKSKEGFKPAKSPTETLATQATPGGGESPMKGTGMLVGTLELKP